MRLKHRSSVVLGGLFLLLLCCSFSAPGSAAAITAEPMYMITQSEMERLSDNLTRLKKINEESQIELKALRKELATSKVELTEARKQSTELKNQLDELTAASRKQEASLKTANESLKEYAREEKRTRLRIKAQRNTWEAVATGLLVAWAAK